MFPSFIFPPYLTGLMFVYYDITEPWWSVSWLNQFWALIVILPVLLHNKEIFVCEPHPSHFIFYHSHIVTLQGVQIYRSKTIFSIFPDLNSRSKFYSHCRHIKSKLLIKKVRGKMDQDSSLGNNIKFCSYLKFLVSYFNCLKRADILPETLSSK